MIVNDLKKYKNNDYLVIIDNNEYILDEEIILEYRLVKNKEIENSFLSEILEKNNISKLYKRALDYCLKYNKNKAQIYDYLIDKGANNVEAAYIIEKLISIKAINDNSLVNNLVSYLIKKGNGKLLIEKKLYEKQFSKDLIDDTLNNIDYDEYLNQLNNLYLKIKDKYIDDNSYIRINKIKKYLLSRGYTYSDINMIEELRVL